MQIILENKNGRSYSREADLMGFIICAREISRCIEEKYIRRFGGKRSGIWVSRGIFVRTEKRVWKKR